MDLSWIQHTPDQISAAAQAALAAKRERLATLKAIPAAERTFANTIGALEHIDEHLADIQQRLELLVNVHPDSAIRQIAQETSQTIESENIIMAFDRDLWRAAQEWLAHGEKLDPIDQKLADNTIRDLKRMGFHLPDKEFERVKAIGQELTKLESEFERAINDYEDHIAVTREQLAGLPERYIAGLKRDSEDRYLVTLQYPDVFPFMQYAHDATARQELGRKRYLKGGWDNMERLAAMIRLRQEHARLLGYASHADYVTENRMAQSGTNAAHFVSDILTKLAPAVRQNLKDLVDIKHRMIGGDKKPIHFYEIGYWSNLLRKEKYDLDSEEIKAYLPTDHVVAGILDIYQSMLGLRFERIADASLWHAEVPLYRVVDALTDATLGHFALDLHPRAGKYGHAAAFPIVLGRHSEDGTQVAGFVALVCNFPRANEHAPSLISHDETETLFHEFGHVMHGLLSSGRWQRQNGFGVAMDFIEALSQIFEYWAWDPTVLTRITKHYQTGQPMPDELVQKMLKARYHMDGLNFVVQAIQALYDLRMHMQPTDAPVDSKQLAQLHRDMTLEYEHIDLPEDAIFAAGWSHMADYDAGYYGYLWSKVFAADMFTRFAPDPLNTATGRDYRDKVLAPGSSRKERVLVEDFLGRPSNSDAFLQELGIANAVEVQ